MAITTIYRGIEYRSRLEARWAAFFNAIGWTHTYEPFDGDGYIPDFLIHGAEPLLVEVKPAVTAAEYQAPLEKVTAGLAEHWRHDILIVGASPTPAIPDTGWDDPRWHPVAGLLGEHGPYYAEDEHSPGWCWDNGLWATCTTCSAPALFHTLQSYTARPCGHHDGGGNLSGLTPEEIATFWAGACNDVKWRGRGAA